MQIKHHGNTGTPRHCACSCYRSNHYDPPRPTVNNLTTARTWSAGCNRRNIVNSSSVLNHAVYGFDARGVAKRFRHAAIFGALESLEEGETMRFVNDHDPLPLLNQISQRYGNQIAMSYVAREPSNIVIDFMVQTAEQAAAADAANARTSPAMAGSGCGSGGCGCSGGR